MMAYKRNDYRPQTMSKQVLFIGGGGNDGYQADAKLVASLQNALGANYAIKYPMLETDQAAPDFGWLKQIGSELGKLSDDGILVAHSLGASLLLKYLSEYTIWKPIERIFLLATPYWSGQDAWVEGLKLQPDFAEHLPQSSRLFFYHCRDDEEIPFDHLAMYRQKLPMATFREVNQCGHQFGDNLTMIAEDIKAS
ncbi:alpha/beta hydrolase [Spirosoma gilvum]